MNKQILRLALLAATSLALTGRAESTGSPFYGDPPDATHPWCVHDWNRPQPPRVEPKPLKDAKPPEGAVVLFDGTDAALANWEADKPQSEPTKWVVKDGAMVCVPKSGYVRTKEKFGDIQLHVEWSAPTPPQGESQGRGNSGIFLPGGCEVQVLDNYDNPTYADGFACSYYGVNPPAANALRPPGEWQQIDITFRRPVYEGDKETHPGYITVYCNGVLVQDKTKVEGAGGHKGRSKPRPFADLAPLRFQDHGNPVKFRNVWLKPLPPRTAADDEGVHGPMTEQETAAKRKELAAMVRADAARLDDKSMEKMFRLAESLVYEQDKTTAATVTAMANAYAADIKALPAAKLDSRKEEIKRVNGVLKYLAKFNIFTCTATEELASLVKAQGWEKK